MEKGKLKTWRDDFEEGAIDAVSSDGTYIASAIGGIFRGVVTGKPLKGIEYAVWGIGFQVIWNGVARVFVNSHYEKKDKLED